LFVVLDFLLNSQVTIEEQKEAIAMRRDEGLPVTALRACVDYKGVKRVQGESWIVTGMICSLCSFLIFSDLFYF
jgi:hypothetical protein